MVATAGLPAMNPCPRCGNPGAAQHTCPYHDDVNDDLPPKYCNCCESCTQDCIDDI